MCPEGGLEFSGEIFLAVYNPGIGDRELVQIFLNTSNIEVTSWYPYTNQFLPLKAEAFCHINLET